MRRQLSLFKHECVMFPSVRRDMKEGYTAMCKDCDAHFSTVVRSEAAKHAVMKWAEAHEWDHG